MFKDFHGYQIYDDGTIYSTKTNKWLRFDYSSNYAQVYLSINGKPTRYKVSRLVAFFFCNPPENYYELTVDHINGNHRDNRAINLEWVTISENNRRARVNGRNNIRQSNSDRWLDEEFRQKTSENFSRIHTELGCHKGVKNGRYRFEIKDSQGNQYFMSDLAKLIGRCESTTYQKILKFLVGDSAVIDEFAEHDIIHIVDLKSEVNRLSKANDVKEEKTSENKPYKIMRTKRIE